MKSYPNPHSRQKTFFSRNFLESAERFCDAVHDFCQVINLLAGLEVYFKLTAVGSTRYVCE